MKPIEFLDQIHFEKRYNMQVPNHVVSLEISNAISSGLFSQKEFDLCIKELKHNNKIRIGDTVNGKYYEFIFNSCPNCNSRNILKDRYLNECFDCSFIF